MLTFCSQQQNALGYNLSMQGVGTVAIDGPRLEEFLRSRTGGLARGARKDFAVGLHSWVNLLVKRSLSGELSVNIVLSTQICSPLRRYSCRVN